MQHLVDQGLGEHFTFKLTDEAKQFLLAEGIDYRHGARHLKRAVERFVVFPLANLPATRQVVPGDVVMVGNNERQGRLVFFRDEATASVAVASQEPGEAVQPNSDHVRMAA